jgi:hypothetical protein
MNKLERIFDKVLRESEQEYLELVYTDTILLSDALFDNYTLRESDISNIEERKIVIDQIKRRDFGLNTENFKESLDIACDSNKHGEYLVKRSLKSLKQMKTFKVKDLNAGFALEKMEETNNYSKIVAMHNNSKHERLGMYLLDAAEELGGKYLECFGEYLNEKIYAAFGFKVYNIKENVKMKNGKIENLYFMKLERVVKS